MAKDLFSKQASIYAKYRPTYPPELIAHLLQFVKDREASWDCATGNGQAAAMLAPHFNIVHASDISEAQLANAVQKANIKYHVAAAEHTTFANDSFDLITIATAYHWLNWKAFHKEASRVAKAGAVIAAWCYQLFSCEDENVNRIIKHFYYNFIGTYWDPERRFVDEAYQTVDFDFEQLPSPSFGNNLHWNKGQFLGYLETWSAVQHYIKQQGHSPLLLIEKEINNAWKDGEEKHFHFPIALRVGRIVK